MVVRIFVYWFVCVFVFVCFFLCVSVCCNMCVCCNMFAVILHNNYDCEIERLERGY